MILYLSGPMTGYPDFNYPAFHAAKSALEARGYGVVSPADLPIRDDWEWCDYILVDIDSVFQVDGVATLPDADKSNGARIECRIAERRGIAVRTVRYWIEIRAQVA